VPRELTSFAGIVNQPVPEWTTLITSQFLHGGFALAEYAVLWIFSNVEDRLGHVKYLIFLSGVWRLASLTQWFFSLLGFLGASGAIAGVMGAYILRFPRAEILTLIPLGCTFLQCDFPRSTFSVLVSPTNSTVLLAWSPSTSDGEWWDCLLGTRRWLHLRSDSWPLLGLFGQNHRKNTCTRLR